ncbi:hypothetical protein [Stigmatella erecta]|uniref:Uncharacterized protein n=1 Tax=Stigmatella erecta TaxID=83460 RepID=A0A1I0IKH9_9BACT|nr:hypothetical protein [Stigmatella erecta]SET97452.1 hypothetical protein SAMN05443639_106118 [Stigmatella erecta]
MKLAVKILVALSAIAMTACGTQPGMGGTPEGESAPTPQQELSQDMGTLAAYDCSVSIQCADGSSRSCNGSSGACSASSSGSGSVTCNGNVTSCGLALCTCNADGCCATRCIADPDCSGGTCQQGAACTTSTQCGTNGVCRSGRCTCLLEPVNP